MNWLQYLESYSHLQSCSQLGSWSQCSIIYLDCTVDFVLHLGSWSSMDFGCSLSLGHSQDLRHTLNSDHTINLGCTLNADWRENNYKIKSFVFASS